MKKLLSLIVAAMLLSAPSNAAINTNLIPEPNGGPGNCVFFTGWVDGDPDHGTVDFAKLCSGAPPWFDIYPTVTFDGQTLATHLATRALVSHSHVISDTTGLQTALDGKQAAGSYAAAIHTHAISDVTGLTTALTGKASSTHTHAYADLTGLPTLFSGAYADLAGKPTLFSGAYADLTGKPTLFSGAYADLSGKPSLSTVATSGSYNDLSNKPATGPAIYVGNTLKTGAKVIYKNVSVTAGTGVTYLTDNGLVGGNALCTNVYDDSVNITVNDATAAYQTAWAITNGNKTMTVTANKAVSTGVITLLGISVLGAPTAVTGSVKVQISCD